MNISPETKKISEIFSIESEVVYKIPIYQRNYSWGSSQIETFINDISNEEDGYYVGNLLTTSRGSNEIEIVDGQQRLTTVALILISIYELANEHYKRYINMDPLDAEFKVKDKEKLIKNVSSIMEDIKRKLLINGNYPQQKYKLIKEDNDIYLDLLKITEDKDIGRWKHRKFGKRHQFIVNTLRESFENFVELNAFYKKLNSVEVLKISVTKLSDAFSIFSALNSKGLPLTLVDLLKNEYLKKASNDKINEIEAIQYWESLLEYFADENKDTNNSLVTRFLLNNFDAFESEKSSSITKSKALDEYIKLISNKGSRYIIQLIERASWFLYLSEGKSNKHESSDVNSQVKELSLLDASQAFPLLMYLFEKQSELDIDHKTLSSILKEIKRFYIIRNVTLRPKASNVRQVFVFINRRIVSESIKNKEIFDLVKTQLRNNSDEIDEFKKQLLTEGIYDKNKSTTRYLLIQLETRFGEFFNKSNPNTLDDNIVNEKSDRKVKRWTIEHIFPQGNNLPKYWLEQLNEENQNNIKQFQEDNVHKIGNLTLTPYNAELGQKSFKEKLEMTDKGSLVGLKLGLFLNKSIVSKAESLQDKMSWTIEDIDRRSEYLANKIIEMIHY